VTNNIVEISQESNESLKEKEIKGLYTIGSFNRTFRKQNTYYTIGMYNIS